MTAKKNAPKIAPAKASARIAGAVRGPARIVGTGRLNIVTPSTDGEEA